MSAPSPALVGDSICVTLGGRRILESAYVDAVPGTITALVGRSGAGKTTLFNILVGRRRPDRGQVRWLGTRLARPTLPTLARGGLFFHPDRPWLSHRLSFLDHVALADVQDWRDVAERFQITTWLGRAAGTLSEGELRLTELAFGFALQPTVALLDEPFRGLEPLHREQVAAALRDSARRGTAVLYADHDVDAVARTADRLFSMENGSTRLVSDFNNRPRTEWYHAWPR
jgi:ABC-type multidrug transport system ATPase subunit